MPSETIVPGSADDWLRYARSDLELARIERPAGALLESLCFHAQQAAEKALKAALVFRGDECPRTHNIRTLLDLLSPTVKIPEEVSEAAMLTDYAVELRYPGDIEPVEEEEHQQAVRLAEFVVRWVESLVRGEEGA